MFFKEKRSRIVKGKTNVNIKLKTSGSLSLLNFSSKEQLKLKGFSKRIEKEIETR